MATVVGFGQARKGDSSACFNLYSLGRGYQVKGGELPTPDPCSCQCITRCLLELFSSDKI